MKIVKNRNEYYTERYRNAGSAEEFIKLSTEDMNNTSLIPKIIEPDEAVVLGIMFVGAVFIFPCLFYVLFFT